MVNTHRRVTGWAGGVHNEGMSMVYHKPARSRSGEAVTIAVRPFDRCPAKGRNRGRRTAARKAPGHSLQSTGGCGQVSEEATPPASEHTGDTSHRSSVHRNCRRAAYTRMPWQGDKAFGESLALHGMPSLRWPRTLSHLQDVECSPTPTHNKTHAVCLLRFWTLAAPLQSFLISDTCMHRTISSGEQLVLPWLRHPTR